MTNSVPIVVRGAKNTQYFELHRRSIAGEVATKNGGGYFGWVRNVPAIVGVSRPTFFDRHAELIALLMESLITITTTSS